MIQIMSSNGEISYGVNDYVIDTDDELNEIPSNAEGGSTAYSIESGTTFIKDNMNEWSILNTSASSGGGIIELPDNILYSYEMTEEEFWNGYSQGLLSDGLYGYDEEGLYYPVNTVNIQLSPNVTMNSVNYDNFCWAISYNFDTLLKFDEKGNVKNQYNINDYFNLDHPLRLNDNSQLVIDKNGFLYLNCHDPENGQYYNNSELYYNSPYILSTNLNTIDDIASWKIINYPEDFDEFYDRREWCFSTFSYSPNNSTYVQDDPLLTKEGGLFAFDRRGALLDGYDIAYFKEGKMQAIVNHPYRDGIYNARIERQLYAVDPILNILYYTYQTYNFSPQGVPQGRKLEIWKFDPYAPEETQRTLVTSFNCNVGDSAPNTVRMLFKNDLLFLSYVEGLRLHYYLYDTISQEIIQSETIDLATREGSYDTTYLSHYFAPYEYKNHIYAPIYIPIYDNSSYIEMIDIDTNNLVVNCWEIDCPRLLGINEYSTFKDSCIDNYFLVYNNSKFIIYNLLTQETVTEVNEFFNNAYTFWNNNSLNKEYLIVSYYKNDNSQFNLIKINPHNGNIEQKMINEDVSNSYLSDYKNLLLYLKDLNKFLFGNSYIIDPISLECERLSTWYYYKRRYIFGNINGRYLFTTQNQADFSCGSYYTYNPQAKKQYSILLHRDQKLIDTYKFNIPEKEGVDI